MAELTVEIVAADRKIYSGPAKSLVAKTTEGEIGILPGHEPVLALLVDGAVTLKTPDGEAMAVAVHEGFFSVDHDAVVVLADTAELASDIDVERAKAALARAQSAAESPEQAAAVRRAETRLRVAEVFSGAAGMIR